MCRDKQVWPMGDAHTLCWTLTEYLQRSCQGGSGLFWWKKGELTHDVVIMLWLIVVWSVYNDIQKKKLMTINENHTTNSTERSRYNKEPPDVCARCLWISATAFQLRFSSRDDVSVVKFCQKPINPKQPASLVHMEDVYCSTAAHNGSWQLLLEQKKNPK